MVEDNFTTEEIQQHIENCFHSYNLCEELSALESLDEEQTDRLDRNERHIQIMLAKDWFRGGCTAEQITQLETYL